MFNFSFNGEEYSAVEDERGEYLSVYKGKEFYRLITPYDIQIFRNKDGTLRNPFLQELMDAYGEYLA